jgi:hypothetical protein
MLMLNYEPRKKARFKHMENRTVDKIPVFSIG